MGSLREKRQRSSQPCLSRPKWLLYGIQRIAYLHAKPRALHQTNSVSLGALPEIASRLGDQKSLPDLEFSEGPP